MDGVAAAGFGVGGAGAMMCRVWWWWGRSGGSELGWKDGDLDMGSLNGAEAFIWPFFGFVLRE